MIIYKFDLWCCSEDKPYTVTEIEVEEKNKIYMGVGRDRCRIRKDEIGVFSPNYGHKMYCLSNDPHPYIDAMIALSEKRVTSAERNLVSTKETLALWEKTRGEINNGI